MKQWQQQKVATIGKPIQPVQSQSDSHTIAAEKAAMPREMEGSTSTTLSLDPALLTTESMEKMKQWQQQKAATIGMPIQPVQSQSDSHTIVTEKAAMPREMEDSTSTTLSLDPALLTTESMEKMKQWQQQKAAMPREREDSTSTTLSLNQENMEKRKQLQQQKAVVNTPIQPVQTQSNDHKITPDDDNSVKGKIAKYNAMIQAQALAAGSSIINISPNRIPNAHKKEVHSHKEKLKR